VRSVRQSLKGIGEDKDEKKAEEKKQDGKKPGPRSAG
jgi:hypothetical protein